MIPTVNVRWWQENLLAENLVAEGSSRPCSLGGCRDTGVPRRVPVEPCRHDASRATPTTLKPVLFHTAWFVRSNFFSSLICWARQINIFYDIIWKLLLTTLYSPKILMILARCGFFPFWGLISSTSWRIRLFIKCCCWNRQMQTKGSSPEKKQ